MSPSTRPRRRRLRYLRTAYTVWLTASAAGAIAFGALSVYNAIAHHTFDWLSLIVCGSCTNLTLDTARDLDKLRDADILAWLRNAPLPCSADNLARHLGLQPGPVRLSLRRLQSAGRIVVADTANGITRYTAR